MARALVAVTVSLLAVTAAAQDTASQSPNVVVIFTDDQGWADIGTQGATGFATPNLDRMAAEGVRFTDFYVAQPVCSASRTALLTGCYPNRLGIHGALGPRSKNGIADEETTLAELCRSKGYATAIFGKWHLGYQRQFLPPRHGFDEFYGIPYSNDMWPLHPDYANLPEGASKRKQGYPDLPLYDGMRVAVPAVTGAVQKSFTGAFTDRAVAFIEKNRERPFFLYVPHPMPHVPLFCSDAFEDRAAQGRYGDVIEEIDASVGRILDTLKKNGLDERTLVVFTSDNGPWLSYGDHGGSALPLREGKGTTFEGGVRVPFIARWPGSIPAGRICREPAMTIDLFPTVAKLIGADLPARKIDGLDIGPLLRCEEGAKCPHEAFFFYYHRNHLEAMRSGKWKMHFPHRYRSMKDRELGSGGRPGRYQQLETELALFDLQADIGETRNVAAENPDVVQRLSALADRARADLGDQLTKVKGSGVREPGRARPNILFIFSDDHGSQAISAYGSKVNRTPNIDRLAQDGMRFDACTCTNSICAPSRAVVLTGLHSHLNGQTTNAQRFDGSQVTFPKLLQQVGYRTAMIGKWHLQSDPTGFDHWDVLVGQGPYYNPRMIRNGERVERRGYTTDIITDLGLDYLKEAAGRDEPFVLMLQHKAPHRNWQPGPAHLKTFDDVTIPEPPTLFDDWSGRGSASKNQEMTVARHLSPNDLKLIPNKRLDKAQAKVWNDVYGPKNAAFDQADLEGDELVRWQYQRYAKDYLRCIQSVDDGVGRVLDYLDESGLSRNTIVIYTSDQGWYLGEHGWYDKRWMYEESMLMPFLVRWPGTTKRGSTCDALVQNLDFAPTFLEIAGAAVPEAMQGRSLVPLLRGKTPDDWRDSVYYQYYEFPGPHAVARHYGVRTQRHKLMYFYQLGEWEMYDLEKDPDELRSVHDDPEYAELRKEMEAELQRLRDHYKVTDAADKAYDELIERSRRRRAEREAKRREQQKQKKQ